MFCRILLKISGRSCSRGRYEEDDFSCINNNLIQGNVIDGCHVEHEKKGSKEEKEEEREKERERGLKNLEKNLECPITLERMVDPVILVDSGQTYERKEIEEWLKEHNEDPFSNVTLKSKQVVANHCLRNTIEEYEKVNK